MNQFAIDQTIENRAFALPQARTFVAQQAAILSSDFIFPAIAAANAPAPTIRAEQPSDVFPREALLDRAFGEERLRKTCERLREGRLPAQGLSLVAELDGALVGTVRLWHVTLGPRAAVYGRPALMLGPIAVDDAVQGRGIGARLMQAALARAVALGYQAVMLVGDAPYYARFGFSAAPMAALWLPGPYERERFLGLELTPGALDGARGMVAATGEPEAAPDWHALIAAVARDEAKAA